MENYLLKVFDRSTSKVTEVEFCSLDQAIGALNFISCHPGFCFRSLEILVSE